MTTVEPNLLDDVWQKLLDKDDRTSPVEYPDMVLITHEEVAGIIVAASRPAPQGMEALRGALIAVRKRAKNARGAVESNQVTDKDVRGSLTWILNTVDAALAASPVPSEWNAGRARVVEDAAKAVLKAYDECSGAEPSLSVLMREIDVDLRDALTRPEPAQDAGVKL